MDMRERNDADKKIFMNTLSLIDILKPKLILCYVSSPALEVDTVMLIKQLLSGGAEVAVPKCTGGLGNMEFYIIKDFSCLSAGAYGISEPDESVCYRAIPCGRTLCIIPGLAFDRLGRRLGFGKGYYDRFLVNFGGITAGLCYECCMRDEIPHEEHDAVMDYVITENNCFLIGDKKKVFSCER